MRMATWPGILGMITATALAACGNSTTTTTTGSGGSGGAGTGGAGGSASVNACDASTAADHTADADTTVTFGTTGLTFTPPCFKIKKGSKVTFSGDFTSHPLSGGVDGTKDAKSPIVETTTGTSATFTFPAAGTFGFFCEFHVTSGMKGAVFVE